MQNVYVVHYHEIALKGRNRPIFLRTLQENICATTGLGKGSVRIVSGRLLVVRPLTVIPAQAGIQTVDPHFQGDDIDRTLSHVFGISSFSPAALTKAEYGEIEKAVREVANGWTPSNSPSKRGRKSISSPVSLREIPRRGTRGEVGRGGRSWLTFAIRATRGDKQFSMTSKELEIRLGDFVRKEFNKKVDLEKPDVTFYVEVFPGPKGQSFVGEGLSFGGALVYIQKIPGPGGLPVGTQPKVAVLLSGGIDSPVAAHRIMKRGAPIIAVHFHSYPFTTRASIDKVKELVGILEQYHGGRPISLYTVPLAEAQTAVAKQCNERYRVLLYRRLMWRIAEAIARHERAQALVSGESLGQVASQTIENLTVVEAVLHRCHPERSEEPALSLSKGSRPMQESRDSSALPRNDKIWMPLFRPLIGFDKQEIIEEAKRIGTYEISIQPHDDCCSLFMPKQVATRARLQDVEREERMLNIAELVNYAISHSERSEVE